MYCLSGETAKNHCKCGGKSQLAMDATAEKILTMNLSLTRYTFSIFIIR